MKRNLFTLSIFIILALAVVFAIKSKNRLRRAGSASPAIVQQNGVLTVSPQPEPTKPIIIATFPATNATTNRPPSR